MQRFKKIRLTIFFVLFQKRYYYWAVLLNAVALLNLRFCAALLIAELKHAFIRLLYFSHIQLEAFIGNSQSAKACKLSTIKVANECQNTDTINAYSQVLDVCYLKFVFCFIPILQISFWNDGRWVVVFFFWVQIKCFEENNTQILFSFLENNSCDALFVFLLWYF